jgi:hypothetical protein
MQRFNITSFAKLGDKSEHAEKEALVSVNLLTILVSPSVSMLPTNLEKMILAEHILGSL